MQRLTRQQRRVYDFVRSYLDEHGYSPSYEEIGEALGGRALATVYEHVHALETKHHLVRHPGGRGLELVEPGDFVHPTVSNGYVIPPGAKWVPVSALPELFRAWLRERQHPTP